MGTTTTTTLATTGPTPPSGYFGTLLDVQTQGGAANVLTYSNLDGREDAPDYARIQVVMTQTDDRVAFYLKTNGISKPAPGSDGFSLLTIAWALWVLKALYTSRGDLDVKSDSEGQVSSDVWDRDARRLLRMYAQQRRSNLVGQIVFGSGETHTGHNCHG